MHLVGILPLVVCALAILIGKRSALVGALYGLVIAGFLILGIGRFNLSWTAVQTALLASIVITLSAIIVIIPGLYFNGLLRAHGTLQRIQNSIESLPYSQEHKVILLLLGLLPGIESVTGFGVSLFLSVPLLVYLFDESSALRLAMLGMNIMPWGTLALATVVGATIAGIPIDQLGAYTAATCVLVFPLVGMVALFIVGGMTSLRRGIWATLGLGGAFSTALMMFNWIHLIEIAGALSGLVVSVLGLLLLPRTNQAMLTRDVKQVLKHLTPYALVLSLVVMERSVPGLYRALRDGLVLRVPGVSLSVLTSPGVVLFLVASVLYLRQPVKLDHKMLLSRGAKASVNLAAFVVLAQVMLQSGMIATFASTLSSVGDGALTFLSPILGMISGFIAGSNLGGNALTMSLQSETGKQAGLLLNFAAAQNAGAGLAVFTSVPIIVLIQTIAGDIIPGGKIPTHSRDSELLRFGLMVAVFAVFPALAAANWMAISSGI